MSIKICFIKILLEKTLTKEEKKTQCYLNNLTIMIISLKTLLVKRMQYIRIKTLLSPHPPPSTSLFRHDYTFFKTLTNRFLNLHIPMLYLNFFNVVTRMLL